MRFGGIVLAALLTLGACTGSDPEPKEPSPSTSSPRPTATAPTMPAQAKQDSPEGAAAFVKHYIDVFNYAARTGNVDEMRDMAPRCEPCSRYASDFQDTKPGEKESGDVWTLESISVAANRNPIELDADIKVLDEGTSRLTFELNTKAPFEIRGVYMRAD